MLMQTREGKAPLSITSAEFAAMLDLAILPALQSFYLIWHPPLMPGEVDYGFYAWQCRQFAAELGLPVTKWNKVFLPAYISLDHAKIHVWARKTCFAPRQPAAKQSLAVAQRYNNDFGLLAPDDFDLFAPPPGPDDNAAVQGVVNMLAGLGQAQQPQPPAQPTINQLRAGIMRETLQEYTQGDPDGCCWVQNTLHALSVDMAGMMCLLPQQIMPLVEVTPDIHSPIEHLVATVKWNVRKRLLEFDVADELLFKGRTFQDWLNEAVLEFCNGEKGRRHMRGSIDKQKCICQLLRTAERVPVEVEFTFGGCKTSVHTVKGSGGAWISDPKWT